MFSLMSIFIAKIKCPFRNRKCSKRVGNFACRKTLRTSVGYGLILSDHKRRKLSRDIDNDDFQNHSVIFFRKCVCLKSQ